MKPSNLYEREDDIDGDDVAGDAEDDELVNDEEAFANEDIYNDMRGLVEFIARTLANAPDAVEVTEEIGDRHVIFHLRVAEEDKGRVIGKGGRIAEAIRAILKVASVKANTRALLEIE